jgi:hypothetical protein
LLLLYAATTLICLYTHYVALLLPLAQPTGVGGAVGHCATVVPTAASGVCGVDDTRVAADMSKGRIVKVECQCGQLLFRYFKGERGRLIKCFLDQIQDDGVGVVEAPLGARPACPACGKTIGIVRMVRGRPALKLNQGAIKKIRI